MHFFFYYFNCFVVTLLPLATPAFSDISGTILSCHLQVTCFRFSNLLCGKPLLWGEREGAPTLEMFFFVGRGHLWLFLNECLHNLPPLHILTIFDILNRSKNYDVGFQLLLPKILLTHIGVCSLFYGHHGWDKNRKCPILILHYINNNNSGESRRELRHGVFFVQQTVLTLYKHPKVVCKGIVPFYRGRFRGTNCSGRLSNLSQIKYQNRTISAQSTFTKFAQHLYVKFPSPHFLYSCSYF